MRCVIVIVSLRWTMSAVGLATNRPATTIVWRQHTTNLLELLDRLELDAVTIVGHDWGGAIAANAVRRQSDLFARTVLFNTGAFTPARIPRRIAACRTPVLGPLAVRGCNVFVRAALRMTMKNPGTLTADERLGIVAPYDSWANRIGVQRFVDDIPFTSKHPTWSELKELEQALPSFSIPKLLIWGMQDWCFDAACLNRLVTAWPDAEVVRFHDAGHWVVEEKREEIAALVRNFVNSDIDAPRPRPQTKVAQR